MKRADLKSRDNAGLSLVEIVLATALISMGFLAILGGVINVSQGRATVEQSALSTTVLMSAVETMRQTELEDVARGDVALPQLLGDDQRVFFFYTDSEGEQHPLQAEEDGSFSPENLPNPLELEVQLTWRNEQGRPLVRRYSMVLER